MFTPEEMQELQEMVKKPSFIKAIGAVQATFMPRAVPVPNDAPVTSELLQTCAANAFSLLIGAQQALDRLSTLAFMHKATPQKDDPRAEAYRQYVSPEDQAAYDKFLQSQKH